MLDRQLAEHPFVAGDYSIADMACYPWIVPHERQGQKLEDFPHVKRWFDSMQSRPAVIRAYEWADKIRNEGMTEEARKNLFGQTAASVKPA